MDTQFPNEDFIYKKNYTELSKKIYIEIFMSKRKVGKCLLKEYSFTDFKNVFQMYILNWVQYHMKYIAEIFILYLFL